MGGKPYSKKHINGCGTQPPHVFSFTLRLPLFPCMLSNTVPYLPLTNMESHDEIEAQCIKMHPVCLNLFVRVSMFFCSEMLINNHLMISLKTLALKSLTLCGIFYIDIPTISFYTMHHSPAQRAIKTLKPRQNRRFLSCQSYLGAAQLSLTIVTIILIHSTQQKHFGQSSSSLINF